MLNSLIGRLMTFSMLALLLLMTGLGLLLERSFYNSQLNAMQDRLKLHSYSILSVAEYYQQQLYFPAFLQERRFNQAGSGLYAQVLDKHFQPVWASVSAVDIPVFKTAWADQGQWMYSTVSRGNKQYLLARFGVSWSGPESSQAESNQSTRSQSGRVFNIMILEDLQELHNTVSGYRKTLAVLLAALTGFILLMQYLILRWGLKPLHRVVADLENIQMGNQAELQGKYPTELHPLTSGLNRLIYSERSQRERYRNTMADLSHSLKTPLTVMSGILYQQSRDNTELTYQLEKMNSTIAYHLKRAGGGTSALTRQQVALLPMLQSICAAMDKVYADKNMAIHLDVDEQQTVNMDENDLMEVLANLLDNACKYGERTVEVAAQQTEGQLLLTVADDGDGIPEEKQAMVFQRGQRLDTAEPGQGLGLSLVREIADSYQAQLTIGRSVLGGACFCIVLNTE